MKNELTLTAVTTAALLAPWFLEESADPALLLAPAISASALAGLVLLVLYRRAF